MGGNTPFLLLYNTTEFFVDRHPRRQVYRLPKGYHSVTKVKFMPDCQHIALMTEGALLVVRIVGSKLVTDFSIKLANKAIIDFDIDHHSYYILLVSSEGDVSVYDIEKA